LQVLKYAFIAKMHFYCPDAHNPIGYIFSFQGMWM
jgi:hypothetical protein